MAFLGSGDIESALTLVGELLAAQGREYAVVILGGAALNLLGIVERTTTDVDILAFAAPAGSGTPSELQEPPEPVPEPLLRAARTVARDLQLDLDWLNTGPALQWLTGLPPGLERRIEWRRYASLTIGIVARFDLIFFKLFAAADSAGTNSVHYQDLLALRPSATELDSAARWVQTQDASAVFAGVLERVVGQVRRDLEVT